MNRKKKITSVVASVLIFSIAGAGQAQADDITVSVSAANPFTDLAVSSSGEAYVVTAYMTGANDDPVIQLYTDAAPTTYSTNDVFNGVAQNDDSGPVSGFANNFNARLTGTGTTGFYTIRISSFDLWVGLGSETATYTVTYTGFTPRNLLRTRNALRLDTAGKTTEKNNVVSCTPGKYTFLNGSSTPETANIQGYVYTLLVNGTAVSTLSSDSFRSVPSHLFPTIASNMAGTATLDGATWDLKGMSNYTAQCQVYATQSGANTQSVTAAAHDAVALAAAAEAAAAAQKIKDILAGWTSDELASKKARNNRLAGKP